MRQKSVIITSSPGYPNNTELNQLLDNGWMIKTITPLIPCDPGHATTSWATALVIVEKSDV